jgi:hypothetical protein
MLQCSSFHDHRRRLPMLAPRGILPYLLACAGSTQVKLKQQGRMHRNFTPAHKCSTCSSQSAISNTIIAPSLRRSMPIDTLSCLPQVSLNHKSTPHTTVARERSTHLHSLNPRLQLTRHLCRPLPILRRFPIHTPTPRPSITRLPTHLPAPQIRPLHPHRAPCTVTVDGRRDLPSR